jgi:hypothetical protein
MNGALTVGTRHGATIEMAEEAGEEHFLLFGLTAEEVLASRGWYNSYWHYEREPEPRMALQAMPAKGRERSPLEPSGSGHRRISGRWSLQTTVRRHHQPVRTLRDRDGAEHALARAVDDGDGLVFKFPDIGLAARRNGRGRCRLCTRNNLRKWRGGYDAAKA